MKKILCMGFMLLLMFSIAAEGEQTAYEKFNSALGFQFGNITGSGVSYYNSLGKIAFQATGGIVYIPLSSEESSVWLYTNLYSNIMDYNIGMETQFEIFGADLFSWISSQLYLYVGLYHRGYIPVECTQEPNYTTNTPGIYVAGSYTPSITLGAGFGIEVIFLNHLSIPVEVGYAVTWKPTVATTFIDQISVDIAPQVGIRYRY